MTPSATGALGLAKGYYIDFVPQISSWRTNERIGVVRPLARPPALNPSPARRQNASERDGAGHDGVARARLPAAAGELRGLRGDSSSDSEWVRVAEIPSRRWIYVGSVAIIDARLQTISSLSFNSHLLRAGLLPRVGQAERGRWRNQSASSSWKTTR